MPRNWAIYMVFELILQQSIIFWVFRSVHFAILRDTFIWERERDRERDRERERETERERRRGRGRGRGRGREGERERERERERESYHMKWKWTILQYITKPTLQKEPTCGWTGLGVPLQKLRSGKLTVPLKGGGVSWKGPWRRLFFSRLVIF